MISLISFKQYVAGQGRSGGTFVIHGRIKMYVTRSLRLKGGINITNIDIRPHYQKRSYFSSFLIKNSHIPIKIGCVINPHLENWLLRQTDWFVEDSDWLGVSPSFFNQTWMNQQKERQSCTL